MPHRGPPHSWRSVRILDEGNGSPVGSKFFTSCHRAKLDTVLSFCNLNRMQSCYLIKMLTNIIILRKSGWKGNSKKGAFLITMGCSVFAFNNKPQKNWPPIFYKGPEDFMQMLKHWKLKSNWTESLRVTFKLEKWYLEIAGCEKSSHICFPSYQQRYLV